MTEYRKSELRTTQKNESNASFYRKYEDSLDCFIKNGLGYFGLFFALGLFQFKRPKNYLNSELGSVRISDFGNLGIWTFAVQ